MALRGFSFAKYGQWRSRLALGPTGSTAEMAPLHIKPVATPTGVTGAEGDINWNSTYKRPEVYDGTAFRRVDLVTAALQAAATLTVTKDMSGRTFVDTLGSGTTTFTLPDAGTDQGLVYSFVCGDAAGEILINPATGDKIVCKASDGGAAIAPAAGTGVKNTAATNIKGDHLTLVFDGTDTWWATSQAGVWASQ